MKKILNFKINHQFQKTTLVLLKIFSPKVIFNFFIISIYFFKYFNYWNIILNLQTMSFYTDYMIIIKNIKDVREEFNFMFLIPKFTIINNFFLINFNFNYFSLRNEFQTRVCFHILLCLFLNYTGCLFLHFLLKILFNYFLLLNG
jgi:hypothetical protein